MQTIIIVWLSGNAIAFVIAALVCYRLGYCKRKAEERSRFEGLRPRVNTINPHVDFGGTSWHPSKAQMVKDLRSIGR